MANYTKKLAKRPDAEIKLDPQPGKAHTYTSGSPISGRVSVTSSHGERFDEIQITLEGQIKVALEQMSQVAGHSTIEASHTFLRLNMPISESSYPTPRVIEPDTPLDLPFNFVIPAQLLPQACVHKCIGGHVHDAHLQPPPTMGGDMSPNDSAPDMARVHYFVAVKVLRRSTSSAKSHVVTTCTKKIRVVPRVLEQAPLHIDEKDTEYQLVRTKKMKKGVFKGKAGELTFSTTQPKAFLRTPKSATQPQTTAPLKLSFTPTTTSAKPPKLGTLTAKLKASTFASVKGQKDLGKKVDHLSNFDVSRSVYTATTNLATMTMDPSAPWKWIPDAPGYARRDSGYETCGSDAERFLAEDKAGGGHYEAIVMVPLILPEHKTWLPTFHSCLVSRIYGLDFSLSVSSGSGGLSTSMNLRVPVQIACTGEESVLSDDDNNNNEVGMSVEEVLRPRVLSVLDVQFQRGSNSIPSMRPATEAQSDLPPEYAGGFESYLRRESEALAERGYGFEQ